jgi:hypothetical protein
MDFWIFTMVPNVGKGLTQGQVELGGEEWAGMK